MVTTRVQVQEIGAFYRKKGLKMPKCPVLKGLSSQAHLSTTSVVWSCFMHHWGTIMHKGDYFIGRLNRVVDFLVSASCILCTSKKKKL